MKISIYELLGLIKTGKAPKKIKVTDTIYEFDYELNAYVSDSGYKNYKVLLGGVKNEINLIANAFNKNVFILDDEYIKKQREHKKRLLNKLAKNYGLKVVEDLKDSDD